MTVDWVPLALADPGLLSGVFLAACRHLAVMEKEDARKRAISTLAIQYKLVCLRSLAATLAGDEGVALGDSALAKVIALSTDEVCCRFVPVPVGLWDADAVGCRLRWEILRRRGTMSLGLSRWLISGVGLGIWG